MVEGEEVFGGAGFGGVRFDGWGDGFSVGGCDAEGKFIPFNFFPSKYLSFILLILDGRVNLWIPRASISRMRRLRLGF